MAVFLNGNDNWDKSSLCLDPCKFNFLYTSRVPPPLTLNGSSLGQFFQQYLQPIKLNDVKVDWKSRDLSYLMKDKYTKHFADIVRKAKPIQGTDAVLKASNIEGDVRIQYKDQPDFERIARQLGIFQEWKDGIPRTSFKGVVVFRYQTTRRVFLVGPDSLRQLGIKDARNI
ncbi:alpha-1,3-mannosyl-glycoprotein 2-beta-N-acetylglucosaminyltransferase isoform X2 [Populus alba x Populus x berolinensis]|nr:alpha-1,3-mannosyl-glycoprotein 2-beta-N-acetylglucosaminyltransferase isoform X2 [Populus alba x Populus x berolinensis]